MILSAIVAVALGAVPVKETTSPQLIQVDEKIAETLGQYQQFTGRDGRTHVRGFDREGRPYHVAIDSNGHVEADVGESHVSFDVEDAA